MLEAEQALAPIDPDLPAEERVRLALEAGASVSAVAAEVLGPDEEELERTLRPRRLDEFVGQEGVKEQLAIALAAAKARGEALDHVLLVGPPGLGKTTLAQIIREELGVGIRTIAGPALEKKGDMAAILTALESKDVLFVDEIHRINRSIEEILYPALEDFRLDIIVGQGPAARTLTLDLPQFTLVGATTRTGLLTTPLRDRFGLTFRLGYYEPEQLTAIVRRSAGIFEVAIEDEAATEIACRSRGTPRIANRILRRVRDVAEVRHQGAITTAVAREALELMEIDGEGLEGTDRELLRAIAFKFDGGPVGLSTLAVTLGEETDTIEDVYEPYLLQLGFLQRTPRGRVITKLGRAHVGAPAAPRAAPVRVGARARYARRHEPSGAESGAGVRRPRVRAPRAHAGGRRAGGRRGRRRGRAGGARCVGGEAARDVRGRRARPHVRPARLRGRCSARSTSAAAGCTTRRASRSSSTGRRPRRARSTRRRRRTRNA